MKYQLFPNLTADEFEALTADIRERGVMVPVELDENGDILDGHHRAMIADSLGIQYPTVVRDGWTEDQKLVHVVALNAHRRQLKAEERADVVARLRQERLSTRAIARAVGVDPRTVRRDLDSIGASAPMPDRIETTDGRSYPASRPVALDVDPRPQRPPSPAEEIARRQSVFASAAVRVRELVAVDPDQYVPVLDPTQRHAWEANVADLRAWADRVDTALSAGRALHVVNGGSR